MSRMLPPVLGVLLLAAAPEDAGAQSRFDDDSRRSRALVDGTVGYSFIAGEIGEDLASGPSVEASLLYQLDAIPVRLGIGGGYGWFGREEAEGTVGKVSAFLVASYLMYSDDTEMVPYLHLRGGWTQFDDALGGLEESRDGYQLGAGVGVEVPVRDRLSVDVLGLFQWVDTGTLVVDGVSIDKRGSIFTLRAGLFYSLN